VEKGLPRETSLKRAHLGGGRKAFDEPPGMSARGVELVGIALERSDREQNVAGSDANPAPPPGLNRKPSVGE
jgi:hypothetical protein